MQKTLEQSDWAVLQKTAVCNTINANHATKLINEKWLLKTGDDYNANWMLKLVKRCKFGDSEKKKTL